jgi:predicted ribosome-associated RNA-binding protein Tma20
LTAIFCWLRKLLFFVTYIPKSLLLNKIILGRCTKTEKECTMSETAYKSSISRVVISDAAVPFVARGGRLFSGQVIASDPGIENGEQVLVVDRKNKPLRMVQIFKET